MRNAKWLWAVIAAQALFLLGWAGWHEHVRQTAPVLRLKTRPVDPRDLLRGDYMILNYEISRHPAPAGWPADGGAAAFVLFKVLDGHAVIDEIRRDAPPAGETRPWAEAEAMEEPWRRVAGEPAQLRLTYGIERFFVPEGKGTPTFKTLEAEASLGPDHRLRLRRVLVDGKPYP
jgi:uncharacterized membrane-anchored protein